MTIENYIQAGLQHLGVYSESISDIIYFMALLVIIGIINWIIHVLTRQWLARIVLKLTKRTATNLSLIHIFSNPRFANVVRSCSAIPDSFIR